MAIKLNKSVKILLFVVGGLLFLGVIGATAYALWNRANISGEDSEAASLTGATRTINQVVFSPVYTTGNSGLSNSIVTPLGSNPVIFFSKGPGWPETAKLMACSCSNASCSATTGCYEIEDTISDYNNVAAVGADGKPYVVHWSLANQQIRGCKCNNASCSQSECFNIAPVDDWYVEPAPAVVIDLNNKPIVTYHNNNGQLVIVFCNDVKCNSNSAYIVDAVHGAGTPSIALNSDGKPVVVHSYTDSGGYFGNRACTCSNSQCTQYSCVHIEGMDNFVASSQSMAIPMDGSLIVVGVRSLDAQHGNAFRLESCRFETLPYQWAKCTVLDQVSRVGYTRIGGVALTNSSDDRIIISYYKTINPSDTVQSLKTVRCEDLACSRTNAQTLINEFGYWSWEANTSIARAPDGMPIMSYYDPLTQDLYAAKCLDQACTTASPTTL